MRTAAYGDIGVFRLDIQLKTASPCGSSRQRSCKSFGSSQQARPSWGGGTTPVFRGLLEFDCVSGKLLQVIRATAASLDLNVSTMIPALDLGVERKERINADSVVRASSKTVQIMLRSLRRRKTRKMGQRNPKKRPASLRRLAGTPRMFRACS